MKIGINGFEAVVPRFGFDYQGLPNRVGSSEFCFRILLELEKLDKKNEYIIYLPGYPSSDFPAERSGWTYKIIPSKPLWTISGLTWEFIRRKPNLDVFFSPTHYSPPFISVPQVISILDVSYRYYPELFKKIDLYKLAVWGEYSVKHAKRIVTISNSSKDDIIKMYKVDSKRVNVVYPGIKEFNLESMTKEELHNKYNFTSPYLLFVGTLQPRKNIKRLVEAFSVVKKKNRSDLKLVIVGKRGWSYDEDLSSPAKYGVEDSVIILESVSNLDLPAFYKYAECLVLPSLYEGFGLPILEAMKYGCPVITSNISSMPEAGGEAALYVNPEKVDDIVDKIEKVLQDSDLRNKMVEKGYEQIKNFSWSIAAEKTLSILEAVGGKNE